MESAQAGTPISTIFSSFSDGDSSHVPPTDSGYTLILPPDNWLQRLGEEYRKMAGLSGGNARFDRLPHGYTIWSKSRGNNNNNPKRRDLYLYGHPNRRRFDRPKEFAPHLFHLLQHRSTVACPCFACKNTDEQTTAPQTPAQPPTMPAANAPQPSAAASTPPPPPGALIHSCALPPGSWGAMPPEAPHGPAWYDEEREKLMRKLKPELHLYDTHMPGKRCKWCLPATMSDYCTCCRRFLYVRSADTTLPHFEEQ